MTLENATIYQLIFENEGKCYDETYLMIPRGDKLLMYYFGPRGLDKLSNPLEHGWNLSAGGRVYLRTLPEKTVQGLLHKEGLAKLLEQEE